MSNRVNRALADAWLSSDKAATSRQFDIEYEAAVDAYNLEVEEARAAVEKDRKDRSFWDDVGEVVGGGIGTAVGFVVGGPAGAAKGAAIGYKAGSTLSSAIYDLDESKFKNFDTQVSEANNFQMQLSRKATKYKDQQALARKGRENIEISQEQNKAMFDQYKVENTRTDFEIITDTAVDLYTDVQSGLNLYDNVTAGISAFGSTQLGEYLDVDDKILNMFSEEGADFIGDNAAYEEYLDDFFDERSSINFNMSNVSSMLNVKDLLADSYDVLTDLDKKFWQGVRGID